MKMEPLKGKVSEMAYDDGMPPTKIFYHIDVASAVEWLKKKLDYMDIYHVELVKQAIDAAFEDVVNPTDSQTFSKAKIIGKKK
jgi:hypothetical protein